MQISDTEIPPILPDIEQELLDYLTTPERLPIHDYERNQEFWPRKPDPSKLINYDFCPLSTTLKVQRNVNTGEIIEFREVLVQSAGSNSKNSMLFTREPAPPSESTWGSISNFPFLPAGFANEFNELNIGVNAKRVNNDDLLTIPPGFKHGLLFEDDCCTVKTEIDQDLQLPKKNNNVVNLLDILNDDQNFVGLWKPVEKKENEPVVEQRQTSDIPEEEEVIPKETPILKISKFDEHKKVKNTEWAINLDTSKPVKDFTKRVPEMALEYEFELDTFQKLAILQLEQHNHVFVAAHTSAGKTVVAEYAIALSQRHMTRTIYTSPIKALSNQKYRDFKKKFKDVGLVTGDFQINMKGACLIMTTEILRSMLYAGSDVTRDLEFVIFDEVHYVNDKERGHVWEEVFIMLPAHVCVVLLSATVPNTMEFADWLGRTYQRKVYVITTSKRPIPLQHYLYTGCGGSSRDNRFLILDGEGNFSLEGYKQSQTSLLKLKDRKQNNMTAAPPKKAFYSPKQDQVMWSALVDHLNKNKLLPVVAFTFSRKKCDDNARNLKNLDLTTAREKHHINAFFNKCISNLKPPDRNIPQILDMKETLSRGVGVHHSGILPIIKEMIEMLFQGQYIKLLFATETFAMGVNMPARTVIFDSTQKHDGHSLRTLLPAEYIQMAGRAGRRGLDKTGTVIILCKGAVPPVEELKKMMLGKPSQLKSQFRVTYGMVLTLLRVESLSVEGMMSRSFREADHQKKLNDIRKQLEEVKKAIEVEDMYELNEYMQPLVKFYTDAKLYLETHKLFMNEVVKNPQLQKQLIAGRVILITHKFHINKLALILSVTKHTSSLYKVLILTDCNASNDENKPDDYYKMLALTSDRIFVPEASPGHEIITIGPGDIFEITSTTINVEYSFVISDWEKRQMERFRDAPVGQKCSIAIQELLKLTMNMVDKNNVDRVTFIDMKVKDIHLHESMLNLNKSKDLLLDHISSTQIPNFEEHFLTVFNKKSLEDKKEFLQHQLSYASMSLYPEYEKRINVLKELNYINSLNRVELKGKVACEMGMNELLITELVLRNVFTDLQPAEVAALLSALVFQGKSKKREDANLEENLTENLIKGKRIIESVYKEIHELERHFRIEELNESSRDLNFELVEVVYEWANQKPFATLMNLTDVQEGIIVRCIQQLNETICDVRDVARLTGDPKLYNKMEEASAAIKRDIVFSASLYTQNEHT
ncbi:hypothetical protein RN001_000679 [Aquatica leii]|uniref:Helicase SKI2W n=1 Tax=Aquatica leii TaxID=1421715 RepID=A0AAN7PFN7_9COLE|nr:hypothetical protein RN001_000679 [Aquatica leii]